MMENLKQSENSRPASVPRAWPFNDNRVPPLAMGRSVFPEDAVAHIFRPSRSLMTSGKARTTGWKLRFERRSALFVEPLMGWTGSDDTLTQVELSFPTLDSAVRYAERQGLTYVVEGNADRAQAAARGVRVTQLFSGAIPKKLRLTQLQETYGKPLEDAVDRSGPSGPENWNSPMEILADATLSLNAKRSILVNWAYTEYLIGQAANEEDMPEENRPTCLDEVEQALLALEREAASRGAARSIRKAA